VFIKVNKAMDKTTDRCDSLPISIKHVHLFSPLLNRCNEMMFVLAISPLIKFSSVAAVVDPSSSSVMGCPVSHSINWGVHLSG
jgi:hypothetical protein